MVRPIGNVLAGSTLAPPRLARDRATEPVQTKASCPVDVRELSGPRPIQSPPVCGPRAPAPEAQATAGNTALFAFDPRLLVTALAAEPLGPGQQAVVRDQLRLLIAKHGGVDRDIPHGLTRASAYEVQRLVPGNGVCLPNGLIQLSATSHAQALRFMKGTRDRAAIAGMGTLIHEALHGHSPITATAWQRMENASARIDHLAIAAATEAILVHEFGVRPESIINAPYGVDETVELISLETGLGRAAARNVLYAGALQYFAAGPDLHTGPQVERFFLETIQAATGKRFAEPLRRHLGTLPN